MNTNARLTELDRREILRYLGWRGQDPDAAVLNDIDRCAALFLRTARPRLVWRRFPLDEEGALIGTDFRPAGGDVRRLLAGCTAVVFFAATAGLEAERLMRRAQAENMADAVILDACGSAAVENICDNFCADLAAAEAPRHLTERFSPGYGDLPLTQQADFCRLLNVQRRIGVTLTDSGLMIPQKSVTALLGVSPDPVPRADGVCAGCALAGECVSRKEGRTCGKQ